MEFIKKSAVLKEVEKGYSVSEKPLSGIARFELESGVLSFYLTVVGVLPISSGDYFVGILNDKNTLSMFNLEKRPASFYKVLEDFELTNGFAVGLVVIDNDIPLTVAFAKEQNFKYSLSDFKKTVAEYCLSQRKLKAKEVSPTKPPIEEPTTPPPDISPEQIPEKEVFYNDEAVATENYFELNDIENKLELIKEYDFANSQFENELPFTKGEEKAEQGTDFVNRIKNETDSDFSKQSQKQQPYFFEVQTELNSILNKFPPEENLNKLFHDGKFVKVNYSKDKYYVVGLIKENGKEKYLCYGVPDKYSPTPPKELAGYCSFIPLSIFDLKGDGYWMMFQDAITGKCINATPVE